MSRQLALKRLMAAKDRRGRLHAEDVAREIEMEGKPNRPKRGKWNLDRCYAPAESQVATEAVQPG